MAFLRASRNWRQVCLVIVPLVVLAVGMPARADTQLRWKFHPGDKTRYEMTMAMTQEMKSGDMPLEVKMTQIMEMTWEVKDVSEDGDATMNQTIDRVRMEMTLPTPGQAPIKYDSQQGSGAPGTEMLGKIFDAMVGKPFVVKVTPLGTVKEMKAPEGMLAAFKNTPLQGTGIFSEDGLKQMISQSMMPVPEQDVSEGTTWDQSSELQTPPFGKQVTKTEYKFVGQQERDGKKLDKIDVTLNAKFEPTADAQTKLKLTSNKAGGEVLWDNTAGRPVESKVDSNMKFEISVGGQSIEQGVTTTVSMKQITPTSAREL
jgi:Family of unknown function (DUF6263)